ncbi:hypothetical protein ASPWEDRAFT_52416 [Aspergillus wentii DTO 134E9]|uniref:Xylanolytic transcriptional activator regulatory domain-containing protein n=1 Tax=Aspergillus wentii DTO 134E9 TaxID=1073089 RepID=A0A1L9RGY0_ASPWE|nr:uncharacterized protein ASPWEDRAFT_52416 [Aspergillus wentii DTO 134E9]OJJ34118.1 hypothetical protein ASPWEDRAFT_52416 [Aspergillus wentii DTO 134E9]
MRKPIDGSASFLGSSSGIHFIRTVYNAFARRSADLNQAKVRNENLVPGEDDQLHSNHDVNKINSELWAKDELDPTFRGPPSFEKLVQWTKSYFETWHPMFPFLHAPTVLHLLEKVSHNGLAGISRTDKIIIRSIVSISLVDRRQMDTPGEAVPSNLMFWTVGQAMDSLQILFSEPTTIQLLQAAFSVELFLASLLRLNAASRIGGVITRNAFHLGLHRCPARFSCFSQEDIAIRRRLFWSIYCLERYLSQALGVPLSIKDDDIDVCYPGAERHQQEGCTVAGDDNRLRLLQHLAKFAKVRGLILELRNKSIFHSQDNPTGATQVNGSLAHWWNEVYDDVYPVGFEDADTREALSPFHRLVLIVLRHESIISMNRPLLATEGSTPESETALQICIESSRSLITALTGYMTSGPTKSQPNDSAQLIPLVWPSFTWAVWMACLILMYAAWEREFPVNAALRYAKLGLSILENLSLRGSSWPKTCIEAIRDLESALSKTVAELDPAIRYPTAMVSSIKDFSNATGNRDIPSDRPALDRPPPVSSGDHGQGQSTTFETANLHTHRLDPGTMSVTDGQINSHISHGIALPDAALDSNWNGYNSAGLIFGDSSGFSSYPGFPGQEGLSGVDLESIFTSDVWSVADGPWLLHENGL